MTEHVFTALDQLVAPTNTYDGTRWYPALDVLKAFTLHQEVLVGLPLTDKTSAGLEKMLISEPAFYRLALKSEVEQAAELRTWLCLTVIPALWVSNSYVLYEELAMTPKVEGILEMADWAVEQATRHTLPLLRKHGFYFSGMEHLVASPADDFARGCGEAIGHKYVELEALGYIMG